MTDRQTDRQTVKINFCGFWSSFNKEKNFFTKILRKHFNVEISDNPDFVICSNRGKPFEYMKYDCVRIMFMGENMSPDFTVFDYVIGFDYLDFGDRYLRLPFCFYNDDAKPVAFPKRPSKEQAYEILKNKKYFCNFIYGHRSSHGMREKLFEELDKYKHVISPGRYLNNTDANSKGCSWAEKYDYLKASKFTIAGDSIVYPGFATEKIVQPFCNYSVPIYFGNPKINSDFNEKAFIWCRSEDDLGRTVHRVAEIDSNDELYVNMLMQPVLKDDNLVVNMYSQAEEFLVNIFSQNKDQAFRRVRYFCAAGHEALLKKAMKREAKTPKIVKQLREKLKF